MIDPFLEIYNKIKKELSIDKIDVKCAYQSEIKTFPTVVMREVENITDKMNIDNSGEEYSIRYALEIDIYDNSSNSQTNISKIKQKIDDILNIKLGMNRDFVNSTPNYLDTNIYRYNMRYSCIINKDNVIFRR